MQVQVIPWVLSDSNYVRQPSQRLEPQKTVFVGALHGMLNAEGLAHIMHDLFDNVVYAGIDTDKHKYPIGQSDCLLIRTHNCFTALWILSGTTRVSRYQKKHSPTHTHRGHQSSLSASSIYYGPWQTPNIALVSLIAVNDCHCCFIHF